MANPTELPPPAPLLRDEEEEGASLHELIGTLVASRWLIGAIVLAALVAGVLYAKFATPIFRADTLIQVEEKKKGVAGLEDLSELVPSSSPADTEIEILRSRALVSGVVEKLSLDVGAEAYHFWPVIWRFARGEARIAVDRLAVPPALMDRPLRLVVEEGGHYKVEAPGGALLVRGEVGHPAASSDGAVGLFVSDLRAPPHAAFDLVKRSAADVTEGLQKELVIAEKGKKTGIIRAELSGPDPARLVATLDALASAYLRQNVERKSEEAEKTLQFINSQLPELKARLDSAEQALNTYRAHNGSIDLSLETKAAIDRTVELEKLLTELQLQRAELLQRFTASHPFVEGVDKKIARLESDRSSIMARIKNLPESELNSARLMRDVKVSNELYVLLLNKAQELRVVKSGTIGNVRILDRAMAPRKRVAPRLGQSLSLALVLGVVAGVMAAFTRRKINRGVEDPDVLEGATGLGVYAIVPHSAAQARLVRGSRRGGTAAAGLLATRDPTDLAIESVRSLRTSLQFALIDAPSGVIAICGPSPAIGKSFIASNLAQVLADSGKRVLLIDGDLRDGHLHRVFGQERGPGLSDVIVGTLEFRQALHKISDGFDILTGGAIPPNPSELLLSARFRDLLARLAKEYDFVVVDTPPILAVTDAAIIARLSAVTLMVLRAGQHPLREVTLAIKRFAQNGVRPAGLVLNDVTRGATGGAYGYGYHYHYEYGTKKVS